jgi:hypothetical protein
MTPALRLLAALSGAAATGGVAAAVLADGAAPSPVFDVARGAAPAVAPSVPSGQAAQEDFNAPYDGQYHFARIRYSSGRGGFGGGRGWGRRGRGGAMWAHDYPRADYHFLAILEETTYARTTRRS